MVTTHTHTHTHTHRAGVLEVLLLQMRCAGILSLVVQALSGSLMDGMCH